MPRLPTHGDQAYLLDLHDRFDVVFRQPTGTPAPAFAGCALGTVDTVGEMFLLDTQSGEMLWEGRSLPGRVRRVAALPASDEFYTVAASPDGSAVFVADYENHEIRRVEVATGEVTTLAGSGEEVLSAGVGAQIDDLKVGPLEHHAHEVLADVMEVALDGADNRDLVGTRA